ncbi:MAG: response regulator [Micavibrio sp.]
MFGGAVNYNFSKVKVLVVEDMQPVLSVTVSLLKMMGFKDVHGARGVDDAYRLFIAHNHDLIITDWLMEPLDGLDLVKMVRRNEDTPNKFVPVILMTGYSDSNHVEKARDAGITEFLMKPYLAKDMYARIVQVIERPRLFVEDSDFFGPDRRRKKNFAYLGKNKRDYTRDADSLHWPETRRQDGKAVRDLREETEKL